MYLETAANFETFFLQRTFLYSLDILKMYFVVIKGDDCKDFTYCVLLPEIQS